MTEKKTTILERLSKGGLFPIQELYEERNNRHLAPLVELILASEQLAVKAQETWEFKSLAQMGSELFILSGDLFPDPGTWQQRAQKQFAWCVSQWIYYEENEGLLFFVRDENGKYRVARKGDAAYDFVRRLNAEDAVSDLIFAKPPSWAEELFLGYENLEIHKLLWHDYGSFPAPLFKAAKELRGDAVIRETWRRMGTIPGLARDTDNIVAADNALPPTKADGGQIEVIRKIDLIGIITLSKIMALYQGMTNGEAFDYIYTRMKQEPEEPKLFDTCTLTLPRPIEDNLDVLCELWNANWWRSKKKEVEEITVKTKDDRYKIPVSDIAILKTDATKYFGISLDAIERGLSTLEQETEIHTKDEANQPAKWRKAFEYESDGLNALYELIERHYFDADGKPIYDSTRWTLKKNLESDWLTGRTLDEADTIITSGKRKGKAER